MNPGLYAAWYAAACAERNAAERHAADYEAAVCAAARNEPACKCSAEGLRLRAGCHVAGCPAETYRTSPVPSAPVPPPVPPLPGPEGYWETLCEPLGLSGRELDTLAAQEGCRSCHLGPVPPGQPSGLCRYCEALEELSGLMLPAPSVPADVKVTCRKCERRAARSGPAAIIAWAGVILILLAVTHGPFLLAAPGLVLVLAALILRSAR